MFPPAGVLQQQAIPSEFLRCNFTAANNTTVTGYTPDIGTWYTGRASIDNYLKIYNNTLARGANEDPGMCTALWTPSTAPTTIQADIRVFINLINGMQGVAMRMAGAFTGYVCMLYNGNAHIARLTGYNTYVSLGSVAYSFTVGTTYAFRAELTGNTIDFYINDALQLSRTDATYQGTGVGYLGWYTGQATVGQTLMDNLAAS